MLTKRMLRHRSATRIQLRYAITQIVRPQIDNISIFCLHRKGRGEERIAKLVDSPCQPDGESTYALRVGYVSQDL